MEAHPCALASKSCIGKSLGVETVEARCECITVCRKGSKLCIGVHILVRAWHTTLRLAMGGESTLVIWRCHSRPPAEASKLRRRHDEVLAAICECSGRLLPLNRCGLALLRILGRLLIFLSVIRVLRMSGTRRIVFSFRIPTFGCWFIWVGIGFIWRRFLSRRRACGFFAHWSSFEILEIPSLPTQIKENTRYSRELRRIVVKYRELRRRVVLLIPR
jgi:hypothetical protein